MIRNPLAKLYYVLLAALCVLVVACAPTPTREGTGEYIDDSVITTKVKLAIAQDDTLKVSEIKVETFKGRVQLSGFVSAQADVVRATNVAARIKGVKSVANDLRLK